jgi:hypothetical protein
MGTASVCVLGYIELGVSNPAGWRSHAQGGWQPTAWMLPMAWVRATASDCWRLRLGDRR